MIGRKDGKMDKIKNEYAIAAVRVSSTKQGIQGDSPDDQRLQVEMKISQLAQIKGSVIKVKKWYEFVESASGDFDSQPILAALDYCKNPKNKIKYFFFKSIDRSTRGGAIIYGQLKSIFVRYGVQLLDVYGVIGTQNINTLEHLKVEYGWSKYSPTFITELLEAERGKSEVRDILTRLIGAEINYVRMGYRVRVAPPGYINEKIETEHGMRFVLKPHPKESPWFIRMFELKAKGTLTDEEIVREINELGYRSRRLKARNPNDRTKVIGYKGEKKLTVKQFLRYLSKPIYAGVNNEKWTDEKPVKMKSAGLVSVELFNNANKGRITIAEKSDGFSIVKKKAKKWQVQKLKDNPLYPYKKEVLCPYCYQPLLGSASRSKSGKHIRAYHCSRKHKYWGINARVLEETVADFVRSLKFSNKFKSRFTELVLEDLIEREKQLVRDSTSINHIIVQKDIEINGIKETIKQLTSPTTIKMMEADIEKLLLDKAQLMESRSKKEAEQIDIQVAINYSNYYMEHLEDLILGGTNPLQNAAMFGLIFDSPPTYEELKNGTPKLACIFKLNEQFEHTKGLSVSDQGLEP